jgi:DNA polymerase III subunit epsilon
VKGYTLNSFRLERELVVLDTETTGADANFDRVVQIALVRLRPDGSSVELESLVNPGLPIPVEAQRVHGITDAMVEFAPSFKHLAPDLLRFMDGADLGGFNLLRFDIPILRNEFSHAGHSWELEGIRIVDAQVIFHKMEPRDLSAATRFYCGRELDGAHGALADARATLDVLLAQVERYPDLPRDVAALDALFHQVDRRFVDSERKFQWRHGEATFNFGARRGQSLREVAQKTPDYLRWMRERDFSREIKHLVEEALEGRFPTPPPLPGSPTDE